MARAAWALAFLVSLFGSIAMSAGVRPGPGDSTLRPIAFNDMPGWAEDDHAAAFRAFLGTCKPIIEGREELRRATAPSAALVDLCRDALSLQPNAARSFFETRFAPFEISPAQGRGFLTGYYEPEVSGSLTPTETYAWPIRARPAHLATRSPEETLPGIHPELSAALRDSAGFIEAPDRAAIENGALASQAAPLLYVRDEVEAFFIHVQGSARIRLVDGGVRRLTYAGRNGHAYMSIGRALATERGIAPEDLTLEKLKAWLRAHPDDGRALMRRNRSYIFFRIADELRADEGPIGGAGAPLHAHRSLAVDRNLWSYGLPFFIAADVSRDIDATERIARLTIAQDTGSAILGAARGDLFFGAGDEMGRRAGALRHAARFIVLLPRADAP